MEGTKYEIGTIADMAKIPQDALPRFLEELPDILDSVRKMAEIHAIMNEAFGDIGKITNGPPVWVDDGARNRMFSLSDADTGNLLAQVTIPKA